MPEKYDLKKMLKEIEEEQKGGQKQKKGKLSQDQIKKMIKKKKDGKGL